MITKINHDLSIRKVGNELFIYDRNRSLIHTFNATGTLLWEALTENLPLEAAITRLTATFDINEATARKDSELFLDQLKSLGMLDADEGEA